MIDKFLNEKLKGCSRHKCLSIPEFLREKNQATTVLRDHSTVIRDFVRIHLSNKHREITGWSCIN